MFLRATFVGFSLFAALTIASSANASTFTFTATLLGSNEVPPNLSTATGNMSVTLDDGANTLSVFEIFSGLIGGNANGARIHCCNPPGANAAAVLLFPSFPATTSGTYSHTFDLTTDLINITLGAFITGLEGGLAYANISDAVFQGGEIRGQLTATTPLPAALPLFASGLGALGVIGWRRKRKAN